MRVVIHVLQSFILILIHMGGNIMAMDDKADLQTTITDSAKNEGQRGNPTVKKQLSDITREQVELWHALQREKYKPQSYMEISLGETVKASTCFNTYGLLFVHDNVIKKALIDQKHHTIALDVVRRNNVYLPTLLRSSNVDQKQYYAGYISGISGVIASIIDLSKDDEHLFDIKMSDQIKTMAMHNAMIALGTEHDVKIYNIPSAALCMQIEIVGDVQQIAFSSDGAYMVTNEYCQIPTFISSVCKLLTINRPSVLRVWDRETNEQVWQLDDEKEQIVYAVDHNIIILGTESTVQLCDMRSKTCQHLTDCINNNNLVALVRDPHNDENIIMAENDGSIYVYDIRATGKYRKSQLRATCAKERIITLDIAPDNEHLLGIFDTGKVVHWSLVTQKSLDQTDKI